MSIVRNFRYLSNVSGIKIISYNILAPLAAKYPIHMDNCPSDCIDWNYRFKLIQNEVLNLKPDIINLQEAEVKYVFRDIKPFFEKKGFKCFFKPQKGRTNRKTNTKDNNFGVMTIIHRSKFETLKKGHIDYHKLYKNYIDYKFYKKAYKRFASLVLLLHDKQSQKNFYVINVHLESKPLYDDIKNLQSFIIMKYIEKISTNKIPIILSGDFNSKPDSSAYYGITTGKSKNQFDMENFKYPKPFINTPDTFTTLPMKSAYKEVFGKEPLYSNYTLNFKSTLDYIFFNKYINIVAALEEVNKEYLNKYSSMPNYDFPSDHFMQSAIFKI